MAYQNLFNKLHDLGITALESEMFEVIDAYKKDLSETSKEKSELPTELIDKLAEALNEILNTESLTTIERLANKALELHADYLTNKQK